MTQNTFYNLRRIFTPEFHVKQTDPEYYTADGALENGYSFSGIGKTKSRRI